MAPALKTTLHTPPPARRRLDQGSLGACTGFSVAQALNTDRHRRSDPWLTGEGALDIYSAATNIDPWPGDWPPDDTGSSVLCAAKSAVAQGHGTGYRWAFGLDQVLAALMLQPVVVGTVWRGDMFRVEPAGFVHASGGVVGGHAYCLHGLNVRDRYVWILNSWGTGWGWGGRAKLSFDDLGGLLADDGEAVTITR